MSSYRVLNYKEFELDNNITYDLPMKQDMYYLAMNTKLDRYFQTPKLKALSGICLDEYGNHYIDMSIENKDSFDYFIQKLDEFNILNLFENCTTWFNDNFKYSVINNLYINSRFRRKNHSENSVRLYFSKNKDNQLSINIFNENKGKLTIDDILPNNEYTAIIRINCLKISKKNVSCILELVQLKYFEKSINLINSIQNKYIHNHNKTTDFSNNPVIHQLTSSLVENKEPQVENKEPQVENKEPQVENKEHQVENKEHQIENKEPRVENKEHQIENKEHQIENKEPQVENKEPRVENKEPQVENGIEKKELRIENKKSSISKVKAVNETDKVIKINTKKSNLKKKAKKAFQEAEQASKEADTLRLKAIKAASMAKQYDT